ncbi:hypothetical protein JMJ77_0014522, partial [Colletotrichum scovillei]
MNVTWPLFGPRSFWAGEPLKSTTWPDKPKPPKPAPSQSYNLQQPVHRLMVLR